MSFIFPRIEFVGASPEHELDAEFRRRVASAGNDANYNANPAFLDDVFTYRALVGRKSHTFISTPQETIDVSKIIKNAQGARLFKFRQQVYAAVDTKAEPGNKMYVLPVGGNPIELDYDGRSDIERNWIFVEFGDRLYAVYSLAPLRILKVVEQTDTRWTLKEIHRDDSFSLPALHNGGAMAKIGDDGFMMAHRLIPLGSPIEFIGVGSIARINLSTFKMSVSPVALSHDLISLCGPGPRRVGMRALTYFAGMDIGDRLRLSYGINDKASGFASLPLSILGDTRPIAEVITQEEIDFAKRREAETQERRNRKPLPPPTDTQIRTAIARGDICRTCEHLGERGVRLTLQTGRGIEPIYRVSCKLCSSCGGGLSLINGKCKAGKWSEQ